MTGYTDVYSDTYVADPSGGGPVVASWSGSFAEPASVTSVPPPGTLSLPVAVANVAGDWMIACVAWRNPPGYPAPTFTIADDVHNWWEPLLTPGQSISSPLGLTQCSIWMAPAARAAAQVYVAPQSYSPAFAATIYDVATLLPWVSTLAATGFANAATALTQGLGAPASQAIVFAAGGADDAGAGIALGGAGWSAVTTATATNGADDTADILLSSAWQVTTGATSAAWTAGIPVSLAAVSGGPLMAAPALSSLNPAWPVALYETAPGSGFQTPPDAMSWVPLTAQAMDLNMTQGRQYETAALSTGEGTLYLDNPAGALIPPGTGSFAGIDSGTPVRVRTVWQGGSWQVSFHGDGTTPDPQASAGSVFAFAVTPLAAYSASAWLSCSPPWPAGVALLIAWYTSGGAPVSAVSSALVTGTAATLATATGTAPGSAAYAAVIVQASGTPPSTTTFYASAAPPIHS